MSVVLRHYLSGLTATLFLILGGCEVESQLGSSTPQGSPETAAAPAPGETPQSTETPRVAPEGTLTTHFFDVGQGDCTALVGPDFTIVIDAGRHDRKDVVPHLRAAGVESISLLIGTHPHADHIGQFDQVIGAFPVDEVWMSGDKHTSKTFERALDAVLESEAGYHEPRAGEKHLIGSALVEVLHPAELTGDLNDGSVSVRIGYGSVAFVFTGDAEAGAESEMLEGGHNVQAQILQLGHHGSRTSSTPGFLRAVKPEVAIYSAGEGNSYGHPHEEVIERLAAMEIDVYGTDKHGTIRITTDGNTFEVETEGAE